MTQTVTFTRHQFDVLMEAIQNAVDAQQLAGSVEDWEAAQGTIQDFCDLADHVKDQFEA